MYVSCKIFVRFSWQWWFKPKSFGLSCHVVLWYDTNISEGLAASIFTVKFMIPGSGPRYRHNTRGCHNPKTSTWMYISWHLITAYKYWDKDIKKKPRKMSPDHEEISILTHKFTARVMMFSKIFLGFHLVIAKSTVTHSNNSNCFPCPCYFCKVLTTSHSLLNLVQH